MIVIHPPIRFVDKGINIDEKKKSYKLLSIGRLVERKGFQFVIDAMNDLVNDIPGLKYYIAGSGPYMESLKKRVENNRLQDHVCFLGRVTEEEKDNLYKECDYFIMPSFMINETDDYEGFGIVYIEANMYGKYVIATKTGGIPDAVIEGVTGSFVLPQSSESIALTIKNMYNQKSSYSPIKCVEWAKTMDIQNIVHQYLYAISRILSCRE